nr:M23 family metallopeptidase [Jiella sonneratiae]
MKDQAQTHGIDPAFRADRAERQRRRRARRLKARLAFAMLLVVAAAAGYLLLPAGEPIPLDAELVPVAEDASAVAEVEADLAEAAIARPMMLDLPGDPLIVTLGSSAGAASRLKRVERPEALAAAIPAAELTLLSDRLVSGGERLMVQLPSSQADFAFFQTQRTGADAAAEAPTEAPATAGDGFASAAFEGDAGAAEAGLDDAEAAGWGETVDRGEAPLPEFQKTRIEDTTSLARLRPESERFAETEDLGERILAPTAIAGFLAERGFAPESAGAAAAAAERLFKVTDLAPGMVVGVRGLRSGPGDKLTVAQMSIYSGGRFLGTLARSDGPGGEGGAADGFVEGADPFAGEDLATAAARPSTGGRQFRLLDAIYSTGIRNGVPMTVVGEAIMLLSKDNDLDALATAEDRFDLLFEAGDAAAAAPRIRYAALTRSDGPVACFVFRPADETPACADGTAPGTASGGRDAATPEGMVVPVKGVMTSTFGPRLHPILKTVRIHKGVDWAAPVGTEVHAAFAGTLAYAGDGKGYGNLVRIGHGGGRETRYAHLSRFAPGLKAGQAIAAGQLIGYVGTTGLSTGPHLHFELYVDGKATDPLAPAARRAAAPLVAAGDDPPAAGPASGAVDRLVGWIVHVESGGNARAKNPLSSAAGLGQFISSTWLRMIRTYRPDLASSLSEREILDLRYDPTLSREMIRNLAREGEAYLSRRGHQITAGRLYLAHFLGMDGAHTVLSADPDAAVVSVLGPGVVKANPFLAGQKVRYVIDWAERKMRTARGGAGVPARDRAAGKSAAPAVPEPPRPASAPDPGFLAYRKAIRDLLAENGVGS